MKKSLLMMAVAMLLNISSFSQWIPKAIGLLPPGYGVTQMAAASNSVIYAIATDYLQWMDGSTVDTSTVVYILKSTDGGDNWSLDSVNGAKGFMSMDLMVVNSQTIYFTANNLNGVQLLYYSTNGGLTWNYKTQAQVANSISVFIAAFNSNDLLSFGWGQSVATSSDGGNTWTARTTPAMLSGEFLFESSGTNDIALQLNQAWVPTSKGRVFYTVDKGVTWGIVNTSLYPNRAINTIAFSDTLNGIVASSNTSGSAYAPTVLAGTSDGGHTWSNLPSPSRNIQNLTPIPGINGAYMAVADTQVIQPGSMYSLNNGSSWTIIDTTNFYNSVTFYDQTHGWAGIGKPASANSPAIYKWGGANLGINNDSFMKSSILVYPNPAKDQIIIDNKGGIYDELNVDIFNIEGKLMMTEHIMNQYRTVIDVRRLKPGIYFVKLVSREKVDVIKFIKE